MTEGEYKGIVNDVADWIWRLIAGGFNEQQSIGQILVDAAIGMIPGVGDVTAARDIIACVMRLVDEPERRDDVLEWAELVVLTLALIPVLGGAIKGVGKLALRAGANPDVAKLIEAAVQLLNRYGAGNAVERLKNLDLLSHAEAIQGKVRTPSTG